MPKGTIIRLMDRGFGFIKADDGKDGKDLFFHRNSLEGVEFGSLFVGQEVEFETGQDSKGRPQADKVHLTETQASDEGEDDQGEGDEGEGGDEG